MGQEVRDQVRVITKDSPRLINDVIAQIYKFLNARYLRQFACADKHYRAFAHRHVFSASRQAPEDHQYQAQLLKKWAHSPEYLHSEYAEWESLLRNYVGQSLTPWVNRVYAFICLTLLALKQKNQDRFRQYFNLVIIHTEGQPDILNAALYLIAQHNKNDKLKKFCSNFLNNAFQLGFQYNDIERYEIQSSNRFYELRFFSFRIIADVVNETYPINTGVTLYALQTITLAADHFTTPALQLQLNLYVDRILMLFPLVAYSETAASHYNFILKQLLPLLSESQLNKIKNAIHQHLFTAVKQLIDTHSSDRTLDKSILIYVLTWYEPLIPFLDDADIKTHRKLLIKILDEINPIDIIYFCFQWLRMISQRFYNNAKQNTEVLIKRSALRHLQSQATHSAISLSVYINIGICLTILDTHKLNTEVDQFIYAQLLLNNMLSIIMSTELDRSLADLWPYLSATTRSLFLSKIVAAYPRGDYKQKKSMAMAIKSIAATLSNNDKVICLKSLINDNQFLVADAEFIEYTKTISDACRVLSQDNSDPELVDIANERHNKLAAYTQIDKSNLAVLYFNLTILLAIKPSISETVARKLAAQVISALALHVQSLGNPGSPRTVRNSLIETINHINLLVYTIPFVDQKQTIDLILETAQIVLPFLEQLYNSRIRNICYRPLLHAIIKLLQVNNGILSEEHNTSMHLGQTDNLKDNQADDAIKRISLKKAQMFQEKSEPANSEVTPINAKKIIDTLASLILRRRNIHESLLFVPQEPENPLTINIPAVAKPATKQIEDHLQNTQSLLSSLSETAIQLTISEQPVRTNPADIAQPVIRQVETIHRSGDSPRSESDRQIQQRM